MKQTHFKLSLIPGGRNQPSSITFYWRLLFLPVASLTLITAVHYSSDRDLRQRRVKQHGLTEKQRAL